MTGEDLPSRRRFLSAAALLGCGPGEVVIDHNTTAEIDQLVDVIRRHVLA